MAILLLIILVIAIGSKVVYKDNFAILTGTIPANTGADSYSIKEINYPSGYTKDNCVVVASQFNNSNTNNIYSSGTIMSVGSYTIGGVPATISLREDDIQIRISNSYIVPGEPSAVYVQQIKVPFAYKIVLMKIGD